MAHLVEKIAEKHVIARTNQVLWPTLIGGGLLACAGAAAVYDVGKWLGTW
jgi:hypothetical protein